MKPGRRVRAAATSRHVEAATQEMEQRKSRGVSREDYEESQEGAWYSLKYLDSTQNGGLHQKDVQQTTRVSSTGHVIEPVHGSWYHIPASNVSGLSFG